MTPQQLTPEQITAATNYWENFRKLPIGNAEMIMHLATYANSEHVRREKIQFAIEVMKEMNLKWRGVNVDAFHDSNIKIQELEKQLFLKSAEEVFICEDCKKSLPIKERADENYDVCTDCLKEYEDRTGHCSAYCRISGKCDESC